MTWDSDRRPRTYLYGVEEPDPPLEGWESTAYDVGMVLLGAVAILVAVALCVWGVLG